MAAKTSTKARQREADTSKPLSPKQLAIFAFVRKFIRDSGRVPSLKEIQQASLELSRVALSYNLDVLEKRKYLTAARTDGEVIVQLGEQAEKEAPLWRMVDEGLAYWSGGKPKGSKNPIKLTPGPSISDMIHEMRK
jgi:SOS-response transcriptional repressor LexA